MVKKIGRIITFLLAFSLNASVDVRMEFADLNGTAVKEVIAGVPFLLGVTVTAEEQIEDKPCVQNLSKYFYTTGGTQVTIQNINGRTTYRKQYVYQVRIDAPGTFSLGPAVVRYKGQEFCSQELLLTVAREEKNKDSSTTTDELGQAMIGMTIDNKELYPYQQTVLKVRVYVRGPVENVQPRLPAMQNIFFGKPQGPITGQTKINDKEWSYRELQIPVYSIKSGEQVIPAVVCDYAVVKPPSGPFASLQFLVGPEYERKKMVSNPISISVKSLPQGKENLRLVGSIKSFAAEVNQREAHEGDGIVLTLSVVGSVAMNFLELVPQSLPKEFKYYHSSTICQPLPNETIWCKKQFEFVLQGLQAGTYVLPSQKIEYFDAETQRFSSISTRPLTITINPAPQVNQQDDSTKFFSASVVRPCIVAHEQSVISGFRFNGLSVGWFWLLVIVLLGFVFVWELYYSIYAWLYAQRHVIRRYIAFWRAKTKLKKIVKTKQINGLYSLFVDLIAARSYRSSAGIRQSDIIEILSQSGVDSSLLSQWKIFFDRITECAFNAKDKSFDDSHSVELCNQSQWWIEQLQEKL
jgi:hypothetical protein